MKMQAYTNIELKGGMIKVEKRKSLKKEIRSSSTIRGLKPSERGNCKASGTDLKLCILYSPTER
jgi:hypothetical protein